MFTLLLFNHFQFTLIHGPNIPGPYAILFTASDFTSVTSHIHNWALFLLWLCLFFLSGVISPLISSSILGTYKHGEFIFQCPIFLPFHAVHGVLKARILKGFAIPFSSGLCLVRTATLTAPGLHLATADPHLLQRLLDTHGQVWVSLLWDHCSFLLGPGAHKVLFVPSRVCFPIPG